MTKYRKTTEQQAVESILRGIGQVLKLPFRRWLRKSQRPEIGRAEVTNRWQTIEELVKSDNPHNLSQAIVLADKLLDAVLQARGLAGQTMADRLKSAKNLYSDYSVYQGAWEAHKLRNQIAHEVSHVIDIAKGQEAVKKLKKAIFYLV